MKSDVRLAVRPVRAPVAVGSDEAVEVVEVVEAVDAEARWREAAERTIETLARTGHPFTSIDVLHSDGAGAPPNPALLPTVIRAAHRNGLIRKHLPRPVGAVWIGAVEVPFGADPATESAAAGDGAARVWARARARALEEGISTAEIVERALKAYLTP